MFCQLLLTLSSFGFLLVAQTPGEQKNSAQLIDKVVSAKLAVLDTLKPDIQKAYATLYRRLHLDLAGTPVPVIEMRSFLNGQPRQRVAMIDQLVSQGVDSKPRSADDEKRLRSAIMEALLGLDK